MRRKVLSLPTKTKANQGYINPTRATLTSSTPTTLISPQEGRRNGVNLWRRRLGAGRLDHLGDAVPLFEAQSPQPRQGRGVAFRRERSDIGTHRNSSHGSTQQRLRLSQRG